MPAFSKGKWIDCGDYTIGVEDENGYINYYICECESDDFHINDEEARANVRLIAAAPEMYRILCDIRDWCEYDDLDADIEDDIAEVLKAVDGREDHAHDEHA